MLEKFTTNSALGLFLRSHSLEGCLITYAKAQISIDHCFTVSLPAQKEPGDVKPLYMIGNQSIADVANQALSVSSLSALTTLVRPLDIKLSKIKDVDAVLTFQAEPILPYPPESALLDRMILKQTETGTELSLFAVPKEQVQDHLEILAKWNLNPEVISCVPAALASFADVFAENTSPDKPLFVLHLDLQESVCLLVRKSEVLAAHPFPQGLQNLVQAFARDEQITFDEALEQLQKKSFEHLPPSSQLYEAYESFRLEVVKASLALPKQGKISVPEKLLLTGEWGSAPLFSQKIVSAIGKPTAALKPSSNSSTEEMQKYAVPLGLALNALPTAANPINFRQQEFVYPNPWKRFKTPLKIYLSLASLIALLVFLLGNVWISHKELGLQKEFVDLLAQLHTPYETFERSYEAKMHPSQEGQERAVIPLTDLHQQDLVDRLDFLQKEIESTPDIFALYPNVPRVSDVLAWLATHPQVVLKQKDGESAKTALQMDSFSYIMMKRPEQTKKQEKYQVKVEIEFTTATPKLAREFHDALLKPNDIVDPKGEIKWNPSRDRYRVSFFLRDKTVYPASLGG